MANEEKKPQGILESIGGLVGGIGEHLSTGFAAVRDAERAKLAAPGIRNANSEVNQLLAAYKAIDPSTQKGAEKRSEILSQIQQTPTFQKFTADAGAARDAQVNRVAATKRISDLSNARTRAQLGGFVTDDLDPAIDKRIRESFADMGIVGEQIEEVDGANRTRLSDLFAGGLDSLKKTGQKGIFKTRATKEETQAFADKFAADAQKAGVSTSAANALFGELFKEETDKGGLRDKILPKKSKASDFFTVAPGEPEPKASDDEVVKKFDDFVQTATPEFPIDNTPKNFKALGLETTADQQQFQELEKAGLAAGIDVQQAAQKNPEDFKRMLVALRNRKTPNGKKFTIEDFLKLIADNQ